MAIAANPTDVVRSMSLVVVDGHIRFPLPSTVEGTLSANPSTTLRGVLGEVVASGAFGEFAEWFRPTPSLHYPSQLLPRMLLRATPSVDASVWDVRVLLRGDGASAHVESLHEALRTAGSVGTLLHGEQREFAWQSRRIVTATTGEYLDAQQRRCDPRVRRVVVEYVTPCAASSHAPGDLAGNLACSLVKLARANEPIATPRRMLDDAADAARDDARAAFDGVAVIHEAMQKEKGRRYSGSTGHVIPLEGLRGYQTLEGPLERALPWLFLLELHGAGGNTSLGAGLVRLAFE